MAFSRKTREQALIAAARHCCVCQRCKGAKVEVHHITPTADGGTDDPDNAITLCFDCHADAGHYNPRHPRGTKFSSSELRNARDQWHRRVEAHGIECPVTEDGQVWARYLVARDWAVVKEILSGDFQMFPADQPVLANSPVLAFARSIAEHIENGRAATINTGHWETEADYLAVHQDAEKIEQRGSPSPYFAYTRALKPEEIRATAGPVDPVTGVLLDLSIPSSEISQAYAYWELCGSDRVLVELMRLRPAWVVFLAVENVSEATLELEGIVGHASDKIEYRPLQAVPADQTVLELPRVALRPGMTAVVCTNVVLGPFGAIEEEYLRVERQHLPSGQSQQLAHATIRADGNRLFHTLGPRLDPIALNIKGGTRLDLHAFDVENTYLLDRYWEMGSCPHLFFRELDGTWFYWGEVLADGEDVRTSIRVEVPPNVDRAELAELEDETTYLRQITADGRVVVRDAVLTTGETLQFPVAPGGQIAFLGHYARLGETRMLAERPWLRNQLVGKFLQTKRNRSGERSTATPATGK